MSQTAAAEIRRLSNLLNDQQESMQTLAQQRALLDQAVSLYVDNVNQLLPWAAEYPARWDAEFESLCHAVNVLGEASPRALDAISSLGERMSIRLIAAYLKSIGTAAEPVESSELVMTDAHFQAANPIADLTRTKTQRRLLPLLDKGVVPIVTGFVGATQDGAITTLGRGGSDFSAAIMGVALDAAEVWIWTDVDGVMTTDPHVDSTAQTLPELTYREISELAYYGAKVLHPKTIRPVVERGQAVCAARHWTSRHCSPNQHVFFRATRAALR